MASAGADKIKKKNEQNNLNMQTEEEKRDMFAKVKVDRGGTRAMVLLPGLSYNDFDRTGNLSPWGITYRISTGLGLVWKDPFSNFLGSSDMVLYRVFADRKIKMELYSKACRRYLDYPLIVVCEISGLGKSSLIFSFDVIDKETGITLVSESAGFCAVDPVTRKACALPSEIMALKEKRLSVKSKSKMVLPDLPNECPLFRYECTPSHSDTDNNGHVNQGVYLRYIMNGASAAGLSGFYSRFKGDILNYQVRSYQMLYQGESLPGDKLTITTWEDHENKYRLHFQIHKGSVKVNRCTIDFYPMALSKY